MSYRKSTTLAATRGRARARATALAAVCLVVGTGLVHAAAPAEAAVQAPGTKLYVPSAVSGTVSVVDAATGTVERTLPTGPGPTAVAFAPALHKAFVTVRGDDTVQVIDTISDTLEKSIPVGTAPTFAVVDPTGATLFVADSGSHSVSVIDTASGTVFATAQITGEPGAMAINPSGQTLVVADATDGALTEIGIGSNREISVGDTIQLGGSGLIGVAAGVSSDAVYVIHLDNPQLGQPSLDVVRLYGGADTSIPLGAYPHPSALAVTPDGTRLYVGEGGGPAVVIDTATNTIAGTVGTFFYSPSGIVIDGSGTRAYLSDYRADNIAVVDLSTNTVIMRIPLWRPGAVGVLMPPYPFGGFLPPVNGVALNQARAGKSIPIRFSLGGYRGLDIFAGGYPAVQWMSCGTGVAFGSVTPVETAGRRGLSYDAATDTYTFVWKTDNTWVSNGNCRKLLLGLNDGIRRFADFQFS